MGLGRLEETCAALVAGGRSPETPAAVMSRATLPDARLVVGTLATIVARARESSLEAPALLVVGEVVTRRVESTALAEEDAPTRAAR
jgi:siroheme synthase